MIINYQITTYLGITGPAISNLISFTVYNAIRYFFLWNKFEMQPFTIKSLLVLVWAAAGFFLCYFFFQYYTGLLWIIIRSTVFVVFFASGVILFHLSPDVLPVWQTVKKRLGLGLRDR